MRLLGIESSCDETGVAVYDADKGLLSHRLHSQVAMHQAYGGVVPELASRDHVRRLLPLVRLALADANTGRDSIDGVAYTAPQRFDWKPGTTHTLEVPSEQVQGDTHYEFGRWNDDGDANHTITVSPDRTLFTANFIPSPQSQVAKR